MNEAHRNMKLQFDTDEIVDLTDRTKMDKLKWENAVCRKVAEILLKHYPGYTWHVRCDMYYERENRTLIGVVEKMPGAVMIQIPAIMPPTKVYSIPIAMLNTEADFNALVMRAGGELLERFGLRRQGINFEDFEAARPRKILDHKAELPK